MISKQLLNLSEEERSSIKKGKGAGGPIDAYNLLRVTLNHNFPRYTYPELQNYIIENCTNHNPEANDLLTKLLNHLRKCISEQYKDENAWLMNYVPDGLRNELTSKKAIQSFNSDKVYAWDLLSFSDIAALASYKTNWSSYFKNILTFEGSTVKGDAISWLETMSKYYSDVSSNRKLTSTQFQQVTKTAEAFGIVLE